MEWLWLDSLSEFYRHSRPGYSRQNSLNRRGLHSVAYRRHHRGRAQFLGRQYPLEPHHRYQVLPLRRDGPPEKVHPALIPECSLSTIILKMVKDLTHIVDHFSHIFDDLKIGRQ